MLGAMHCDERWLEAIRLTGLLQSVPAFGSKNEYYNYPLSFLKMKRFISSVVTTAALVQVVLCSVQQQLAALVGTVVSSIRLQRRPYV
jgi:hypothetical protein